MTANHAEHEHISPGRPYWMAQLHMARARLLTQVLCLDETALCEQPVVGTWTIKDLLAHIAVWDRWELSAMRSLLAGEMPDRTTTEDLDAFNQTTAAAWRERTLNQVVTELEEARAAWLAWLQSVPDDAFFCSRFIGQDNWHFPGCVEIQRQHDEEHGGQIKAWRKTHQPQPAPGPKAVLLAAMRAGRQALLAAMALVPSEERSTRLVAGSRTLKDVLDHLADWEWWAVAGLRQMAEGRPPEMERYRSIQARNQQQAATRQDQSWDQGWSDFTAGRQALDQVLAGMSQADLARCYPAPWADADRPAYAWATILLDHDLENAGYLLSPRTSYGILDIVRSQGGQTMDQHG